MFHFFASLKTIKLITTSKLNEALMSFYILSIDTDFYAFFFFIIIHQVKKTNHVYFMHMKMKLLNSYLYWLFVHCKKTNIRNLILNTETQENIHPNNQSRYRTCIYLNPKYFNFVKKPRRFGPRNIS